MFSGTPERERLPRSGEPGTSVDAVHEEERRMSERHFNPETDAPSARATSGLTTASWTFFGLVATVALVLIWIASAFMKPLTPR